MIGTVTYKDDEGAEHTAVMNDDGTWTAPHEMIQIYLNVMCVPWNYSPADGIRGAKELHAAADWLKGTAKLVEKPLSEAEKQARDQDGFIVY